MQKFSDWILSRGRSEGTAENYARNVRLCYKDRGGVTARLTSRTLSPAARRLNLASLRAWCRFAKNESLAAELADLKMPRLERVIEKKALQPGEWSALLRALDEIEDDPNVVAALEMISVRGFRVGDVCRLSRKDVREALETGVIVYLAKAGRRIPWTIKPFRHCLEQFASESDWSQVWDLISPRGAPGKRRRSAIIRLERAMRDLAELAELDPETVYPHRLRRTYAKHYLREVGGDPVKLQKHMGWASIQTAMTYVDEEERQVLDRDADRMMRKMRKPRK